MSERRQGFWGRAIGLDQAGATRRIDIFKTSKGFQFVDENLYSGASRSPSEDHIPGDVAALFGLHNVKIEVPHLGVYASKPPGQSLEPKAPWGNVLRRRH